MRTADGPANQLRRRGGAGGVAPAARWLPGRSHGTKLRDEDGKGRRTACSDRSVVSRLWSGDDRAPPGDVTARTAGAKEVQRAL